MTLTLPQPPQINDRALRDHLYRIQQLIEQTDAANLKRTDVATLTTSTVETVAGATTLGQGQQVVLCDTDSGAYTVTLPPAAESFKVLYIKNIGTSGNNLTIDGSGAELVETLATIALVDLEVTRLQSDGSAWWVM